MEAQLRIGRHRCAVRVPVLGRREIAWLLELPEAEVVNLQKRGERAQIKGLSEEDIFGGGALPVVSVGGRRCISPSVLARHPEIAGRRIREDALAALVEGRIRAPRPNSPRTCGRRLIDDVLAFS